MTIQTLEVRFPSLPIGEPVVLYSGELTLSWDGQSLNGEGEIRLDWRPYPRISFRVDCPPELGNLHINPTEQVGIEMTGGAGKGMCRVWGKDFEGPPLSNVFFGSIEGEFLVGNPAPTEMVRFHVPNFPNYVGAATMMGSDVSASRLSVHTDRWQVDLDAVPESFDVYTSIQRNGGFGITHVGSITRTDKSAVDFEDIETLSKVIYWWLSLIRGERTGPMLLSGEHQGAVVWEIWRVPKIATWSGRRSWLPEMLSKIPTDVPDQTSPIFSHLLDLSRDDRSFRALIRAIGWYTQSIESSYLETSVILAQAGLELMSWIKLLDVGIGESSIDNWNAADQIRLALNYARVARDIPSTLTKLLDAAKSDGAREVLDGPGSVVGIRNGVIHPRTSSRFDEVQSVIDGSNLAARYLELLLLNRCQYLGDTKARTDWTAADSPVPWA